MAAPDSDRPRRQSQRPGVSIAMKLLAAFIVLGLATIGITAWISVQTAGDALDEASRERLTAVRASKQRQIETTLAELRAQARAMAESTLARDALRELILGFNDVQRVDDPADLALRAYYETEYLPKLNANLASPVPAATLFPADSVTRHWQERYGTSRSPPKVRTTVRPRGWRRVAGSSPTATFPMTGTGRSASRRQASRSEIHATATEFRSDQAKNVSSTVRPAITGLLPAES